MNTKLRILDEALTLFSQKGYTNVYMEVSEDRLLDIGTGLFLYFLHDDYTSRFRKILTIEQFHNKEFANIYSSQYWMDRFLIKSSCFNL